MNDTDVVNIRWVDAQAVTLKPGDTLVLMHPDQLHLSEQERLGAAMKALFPDNKVVLLEEGMRLGVLTPEAP